MTDMHVIDPILSRARESAADLVARDPDADLHAALDSEADEWLHNRRDPWLGVLRSRVGLSHQIDWDAAHGEAQRAQFDAMRLTAAYPISEATRLAEQAYDAALRSVLLGHVIGSGRDISEDDEPAGLTEIAERLGVQMQTAQNWRTRGVLPEPRWTVGGRPAWSWQLDIQPWARSTGRLGQ